MSSRGNFLAALLCLALGGCGGASPEPERAETRSGPEAPVAIESEIAGFYREGRFRPLWVTRSGLKPEAHQLAAMIADAANDGFDPNRYPIAEIQESLQSARSGDADARARAELLLSSAYVRYAKDLREPRDPAMTYVDAELEPVKRSSRELLNAAASTDDLAGHLREVQQVNPLYGRLRSGMEAYRKRWSVLPQIAVPTGSNLRPGDSGNRVEPLRRRLGLPRGSAFDTPLAKAVLNFKLAHGLPANALVDAAVIQALNVGAHHYERRIVANLERARRIPANAGRRFILVDTAGARLWLFEDGRIVDSMRTIVGKPGMQTPEMAGLIRFAALNPYWNVPPDLIQHSVAKRAAREGAGTIIRQRLQVLTDWSPQARVLNPAGVNWKAVASGRHLVRVRQLPGNGNMMGSMKFMFPNKLGIYLHDTPDKSLFAHADRRLSSGCVRVEDADRLARWLYRGQAPAASGAPEQRVDLPEPVPVYITHLTALPGPGGIVFQKDGYGRDATKVGGRRDQASAR